MKDIIFKGAATALITPFKEGKVDYTALGGIVEQQIAGHIDALVVGGTTGEPSTLKDEEHRDVIRFVVDKGAGRVPVIAGTGSNDTEYAISLSKFACEVGADGLLMVTPYYNKTTQRGLVEHYRAVADRVTKPIIVYNVPSRTGLNVLPETYKELSKHERIVAVKEAGGSLSAVAMTRHLCGDDLSIYSGEDDQVVPMLSLGGKGVISVLAQIMPEMVHNMCQLFFDGKVKEAADIQINMVSLIKSLFCEVNPIPVKAAAEAIGLCSGELRLPLTTISDANRQTLLAAMREVGLHV